MLLSASPSKLRLLIVAPMRSSWLASQANKFKCFTAPPTAISPTKSTEILIKGLLDAQAAFNSVANGMAAVPSSRRPPPTSVARPRLTSMTSGPVAQNVMDQTTKTGNEFSNLAAARQTPATPAATGQPLTHYHSFFSELLSWNNPRTYSRGPLPGSDRGRDQDILMASLQVPRLSPTPPLSASSSPSAISTSCDGASSSRG